MLAGESSVFVVDKLSETNRTQLSDLGVQWVELRAENGYRRFESVLDAFEIPYQSFDYEQLETRIDTALGEIFP